MPDPTATDITSADSAAGDSTTALYRAAIGTVSTAYYLPIFARFEAADRVGMRWNWAASLSTLNWLAYRRLWSAALVYAGAMLSVALMVFGIGRLVFQFSDTVQLGMLLAFAVAAFVAPGLFGDAVFYVDCRKKMAHALSVNATLDDACGMLKRGASSRMRLAGLVLLNAAIVGAVASGYFYFPKAGTLPFGLEKSMDPRNVAVGHAIDASPVPVVAASSPASTASQPVTETLVTAPGSAASAPVSGASAPSTAPAASVAAAASAAKTPEPVIVSPVVATAPPATPEVIAKPVQAKPVAVKPKKTPEHKPATAVAAKKPAKTAKAKVEEKSDPYYINVGLFADENNARNARVKLTDVGLPAFQQEIKTSKGVRTRVRVGPFDTQTEADRASDKIHAMGLEAVVFQP